MANKFCKRYILGEGFPWAMGTKDYKEIALSETAIGFSPIVLDFPAELWNANKLPRYRLVLERIDETNNACTLTGGILPLEKHLSMPKQLSRSRKLSKPATRR